MIYLYTIPLVLNALLFIVNYPDLKGDLRKWHIGFAVVITITPGLNILWLREHFSEIFGG